METTQLTLIQSPVVFREGDHTYWLGDKQLHGVTSTIIRTAFPGKYDGISQAVLDQAAERGHRIHEEIEFHDRFGTMPDSIRLQNYEKLKEKHGLKVIENEYLVSDNETFASSIDIVCVDKDNNVCLVDTKTTYRLYEDSTALQLTMYKRLFELQNPTLKVAKLYALWLPSRDESIAELRELAPADDTYLDSIIKQTLDNLASPAPQEKQPKQKEDKPLPDRYNELEKQYAYWSDIEDMAKAKVEETKQAIMALILEAGEKKLSSPRYTMSVIAETTKMTFNTNEFRKTHEDLYNEFLTKKSVTKQSIRITKHG